MIDLIEILLLVPCTVLVAFILSVFIEMVKILRSKRFYRHNDLDAFYAHEMEGSENPSFYYRGGK